MIKIRFKSRTKGTKAKVEAKDPKVCTKAETLLFSAAPLRPIIVGSHPGAAKNYLVQSNESIHLRCSMGQFTKK